MRKEIAEKLEKELATWRGRLDHLRVDLGTARRELRDRERDLLEDFEAAHDKALVWVTELRDATDAEVQALQAGLEAGWRELRKTCDSLRRAPS